MLTMKDAVARLSDGAPNEPAGQIYQVARSLRDAKRIPKSAPRAVKGLDTRNVVELVLAATIARPRNLTNIVEELDEILAFEVVGAPSFSPLQKGRMKLGHFLEGALQDSIDALQAVEAWEAAVVRKSNVPKPSGLVPFAIEEIEIELSDRPFVVVSQVAVNPEMRSLLFVPRGQRAKDGTYTVKRNSWKRAKQVIDADILDKLAAQTINTVSLRAGLTEGQS